MTLKKSNNLYLALLLFTLASIFYLEINLYRLSPVSISSNPISLSGSVHFWEQNQIFNFPFSWLWFSISIITLFFILRLNSHKVKLSKNLYIFIAHLIILVSYLTFLFLLEKINLPYWIVLSVFYLFLILIFASLLGFVNIKLLYSWKEIFLAFLLGGFFIYTYSFIQNLWPFLSFVVSKIVFFLIYLLYPESVFYNESSFYDGVVYDNVPSVGAKSFSGIIFKTCSGIEGLSLFLFLFTLTVLIDWKKIAKWKLLLLYPAGLLTMFSVNVIRIFVLILSGIEISPGFASGAFHSNLGWILFTLTFILFEILTYKWMIKK